MDRRTFLRTAALGGAALTVARPALARAHAPAALSAAIAGGVDLATIARVASTPDDVPRTGFEQRNGGNWTTHAEEVEFLDAVAAGSPRVRLLEIGRSVNDRPLHLVVLGQPDPPEARIPEQPTVLFLGTQHGNEPAGREAVLIGLRDLAFTDEAVYTEQMRGHTVLAIPTANPDGRAANSRGNARGVDINRDHLQLNQPETQAIHAIMRDWAPDTFLDHHEYGPSVPVLYDADILYLWARNLNADPGVRDLSRTLCEEYIAKGARAAGYTADEYGLYKVGPNEVTQTAGDEDEGISRNAAGLRHTMGILIESAVTQSVTADRGAEEVLEGAANLRRRVSSQVHTIIDTLRFYRDQGHLALHASASAPGIAAAAGEARSRPTYWYGADNDPPSPSQIDFPPPCHYELTPAQANTMATAFALHGVATQPAGDVVRVEMGQAARPVIPLLLDSRARRNRVSGTAVYDCD